MADDKAAALARHSAQLPEHVFFLHCSGKEYVPPSDLEHVPPPPQADLEVVPPPPPLKDEICNAAEVGGTAVHGGWRWHLSRRRNIIIAILAIPLLIAALVLGIHFGVRANNPAEGSVSPTPEPAPDNSNATPPTLSPASGASNATQPAYARTPGIAASFLEGYDNNFIVYHRPINASEINMSLCQSASPASPANNTRNSCLPPIELTYLDDVARTTPLAATGSALFYFTASNSLRATNGSTNETRTFATALSVHPASTLAAFTPAGAPTHSYVYFQTRAGYIQQLKINATITWEPPEINILRALGRVPRGAHLAPVPGGVITLVPATSAPSARFHLALHNLSTWTTTALWPAQTFGRGSLALVCNSFDRFLPEAGKVPEVHCVVAADDPRRRERLFVYRSRDGVWDAPFALDDGAPVALNDSSSLELQDVTAPMARTAYREEGRNASDAAHMFYWPKGREDGVLGDLWYSPMKFGGWGYGALVNNTPTGEYYEW
ncbi:hypothetical protein EDC01DRAFT_783086 [Geopyxis carbonaria]|nr:hypothetical protein EDC01DRAFT_783086 [Geopyxis carbonaria]